LNLKPAGWKLHLNLKIILLNLKEKSLPVSRFGCSVDNFFLQIAVLNLNSKAGAAALNLKVPGWRCCG
jgi:hypothetical protein